jgi:hypothetical protein
MNINFKTKLDSRNQELQEYLFDVSKLAGVDQFKIEPSILNNFTYEPIDSRLNDVTKYASIEKDIQFSVKEEYIVKQQTLNEQRQIIGTVSVGTNQVTTIWEQKISINPEVRIYFKNGILDTSKNLARTFINNYDYDTDGDLQSWINTKLTAELTSDMFYIDSALIIDKVGSKQPVNLTQRTALFQLYGKLEGYDTTSRLGQSFNIDGDTNLSSWSKNPKIILEPYGEELISNYSKPQVSKNIQEVPFGQLTDVKIDDIIGIIINSIGAEGCGEMKTIKDKLLTIAGWPEFMIVWLETTVEVGCVQITISYPVMRTRTASLNFYIYYSLPENLQSTIFIMARNCAINAALAGGVLGVITGNPAIAMASFSALFEECIKSQAIKCLNPGIVTIKEVTGWV